MKYIVGRSVIGLCAAFGMTVGSFLPELWGASGFSVASVLFGAVGGVVGVLVASRLADL